MKAQFEKRKTFELEEHGDSRYESQKSNILRKKENEQNLKCYFNSAYSLHHFSIKNCWQVPKQTGEK